MPTSDPRPASTAPIRLRADALSRWLHPRAPDSHKGDHGHVLCVGGELGSGGAILLCAQAALRDGRGLVSVATREAHVAPILARQPENRVQSVRGGDEAQALLTGDTRHGNGPGPG